MIRAGLLVLLTGGLLLAGCSAAPTPPEPVATTVTVEEGVLAGTAEGGLLRFRGVPYAAPPTGPLRWAPPHPAPDRAATLAVDRSGPGCAAADDCLRLDIALPEGTTAGRSLPVLVWLPGDGTPAGGPGRAADFDPARLARAGLVVVVPDGRTGIEGWFALPGLERSGEFALLDQQAALAWVRANAAAFGGDPTRITLGGSGAGADSVCAQLGSPATAGRFARAILQDPDCSLANFGDAVRPGSGIAGDGWKPLAYATAQGAETAVRLGCPDPGGEPAAALACLRALPREAVRAADPGTWGPVYGTRSLTARPASLVATGDLGRVPILTGTDRDAAVAAVAAAHPRLDAEGLAELVGASGPMAAPIADGYLTPGASPGAVWTAVVTDRALACPGLGITRALAALTSVHAYEYAAPGGALAAVMGAGPDLVADRWASFVRTGDPGWPRFGADGPILTITDATTTATSAAAFARAHRCGSWTR